MVLIPSCRFWIKSACPWIDQWISERTSICRIHFLCSFLEVYTSAVRFFDLAGYVACWKIESGHMMLNRHDRLTSTMWRVWTSMQCSYVYVGIMQNLTVWCMIFLTLTPQGLKFGLRQLHTGKCGTIRLGHSHMRTKYILFLLFVISMENALYYNSVTCF